MKRGLRSIVPLSLLGLWLVFATSDRQAWGASNVVVVLDDSGSMRQPMRTRSGRVSRIDAAKKALSKVIEGLPEDAHLGILLLNGTGGGQWLVPLEPLSRSKTLQRIRRIQANGGTPLGLALKQGADSLLALRQKEPYDEYRLLVVTDGEATDPELLQAYLPDLLSRGILLDVIGVDMQENHSLADRAHTYRRADDAEAFERALAEIFAESAGKAAAQDGGSDFELIADLPDELVQVAMDHLAVPRNEVLQARSPDLPFPSNVDPRSPNVPFPPTTGPVGTVPPIGNNGKGIFVVVSSLPCCMIVVIMVVFAALIWRKGSQRTRR